MSHSNQSDYLILGTENYDGTDGIDVVTDVHVKVSRVSVNDVTTSWATPN
jgi:hypothetical protein